MATRYSVFCCSAVTANENAPPGPTTSALPTWLNGAVYGNGVASSTTWRPAAAVPVKLPLIVAAPPTRAGFGPTVATSESGTLVVVKAASCPAAVPPLLSTTRRKWYRVAAARPVRDAYTRTPLRLEPADCVAVRAV